MLIVKELEKLSSLRDHPAVQGTFNQKVVLEVERTRLVKDLEHERTKLAALEEKAGECLTEGKTFDAEGLEKQHILIGRLERRANLIHQTVQSKEQEFQAALQKLEEEVRRTLEPVYAEAVRGFDEALEQAKIQSDHVTEVKRLLDRLLGPMRAKSVPPYEVTGNLLPWLGWPEFTVSQNASRLKTWREWVRIVGFQPSIGPTWCR